MTNRKALRRKQRRYNETHLEQTAAYRAANRDQRADLNRHWRKANPDRVQHNRHKRRARLANCPINDFTAAQWRELLAAAQGKCAYCRKRRKLTLDHMVPLSRGGNHTRTNITPACWPCNLSKGSRTALEFLAQEL